MRERDYLAYEDWFMRNIEHPSPEAPDSGDERGNLEPIEEQEFQEEISVSEEPRVNLNMLAREGNVFVTYDAPKPKRKNKKRQKST
jgi:hypothetical protein